MNKFLLTINTVKYMTCRQWKYRLYYMVRNRHLNRYPKQSDSIDSYRPIYYLYSCIYSNPESLNKANDILLNKFETISKIKLEYDSVIDWDVKKNNYRLVCFKLNSFKFLLWLSDAYSITKEVKYIAKGFDLIDDWINQNESLIKGDKWNPYVIAERIMHWIGFISKYSTEKRDVSKYVNSIYSQAHELEQSLEYQLGANHLLSEARALMYAGAFLKINELYNLGKKVLFEETKEQFLDDGGHYERSVSYHVESLQQCFEAAVLMHDLEDKDYYKMVEIVYKPFVFLNSMIMCDGNIPLVNDAAIDYPFLAKDFLSVSRYFGWNTCKSIEGDYSSRWSYPKNTVLQNLEEKSMFYNTGFYICNFITNNHRVSIFFDVGDNGPDYNLGHTHADALSILVTIDDKPLFVDSGVFTYMPGKEREQCRSTLAHNTVEINSVSNAEIWSAFRVARRGYTKIVKFEDKGDSILLEAQYDGYSKVLGQKMVHIRKLIINKKTCRLTVDDSFDANSENCTGIIRYHLNPERRVTVNNSNEVQIDVLHKISTTNKLYLNDCRIAEQFGITKESKVICSEIKIKKSINYITNIKLFDQEA